jgi:hypothetical protein
MIPHYGMTPGEVYGLATGWRNWASAKNRLTDEDRLCSVSEVNIPIGVEDSMTEMPQLSEIGSIAAGTDGDEFVVRVNLFLRIVLDRVDAFQLNDMSAVRAQKPLVFLPRTHQCLLTPIEP